MHSCGAGVGAVLEGIAVRISETFVVGAPPEAVFDYMTNPANLRDWQTTKTLVEQLTEGPPSLGQAGDVAPVRVSPQPGTQRGGLVLGLWAG